MTGEPTAALIKDELDAERDARRSFEQRALSLFASAGVIAGLSGIAGRGAGLEPWPRVFLVVALGALAAGALHGLWVASVRAGSRAGDILRGVERSPDADTPEHREP